MSNSVGPLVVATDGAIRTWTINLPGVGNAITGKDFIAAFEAAVDDANADTEIRAVILTGEGKIFSAGGNVKEMADQAGMFGSERARPTTRLYRRNPAHPACLGPTRSPADRCHQRRRDRRRL